MIGWITQKAIGLGLKSSIAGWIGPLIYVLIAAAIFSSGWFVRDKICDAAYYKAEAERLKAEVTFLREQNRKLDEAAKADAAKAEEDAITIADLDARIGELTDGLETGGVCLSADTVDRLRKFWGKTD